MRVMATVLTWRRAALIGAVTLFACEPSDQPGLSVSAVGAGAQSDATLTVGDTATLTATFSYTDAAGCNPRGISRSSTAPDRFVWSSSDRSIADVAASGLVRTLQPGTARITVSGPDGTQASLELRVYPPVKSVTLSLDRAVLDIGDTLVVDATAGGEHGIAIVGIPLTVTAGSQSVLRALDGSGSGYAPLRQRYVAQGPGSTELVGGFYSDRPVAGHRDTAVVVVRNPVAQPHPSRSVTWRPVDAVSAKTFGWNAPRARGARGALLSGRSTGSGAE